jgi:hypothetical protein
MRGFYGGTHPPSLRTEKDWRANETILHPRHQTRLLWVLQRVASNTPRVRPLVKSLLNVATRIKICFLEGAKHIMAGYPAFGGNNNVKAQTFNKGVDASTSCTRRTAAAAAAAVHPRAPCLQNDKVSLGRCRGGTDQVR